MDRGRARSRERLESWIIIFIYNEGFFLKAPSARAMTPILEELSDVYIAFKDKAPGFDQMDAALDLRFPSEHGRMGYHAWAARLIREAPAERAAEFLRRAGWRVDAHAEEGLEQARAETAAEALAASLSARAFDTGFGPKEAELVELVVGRLAALERASPFELAFALFRGAMSRCDIYSVEVHASIKRLLEEIEAHGMLSRRAPGGFELRALEAVWGQVDGAFLFEMAAQSPPESGWGLGLRAFLRASFETEARGFLEVKLGMLGRAAATRGEWDGAEGVWERQAVGLLRAFEKSPGLLSDADRALARSGALASLELASRAVFESEREAWLLQECASPGVSRGPRPL